MLIVACLPMLADDCPPIASFSANDVQTGEPVTFHWSYAEGAVPQSQTLTGHDFDPPVILSPDARGYTYMPSKPGEKHAQLAATMPCGTVSTATKYKVKQCNVVAPAMTVDQTSVAPGAAIHAAIDLKPGHTARWEVLNGTASAATGSAITVTAGSTGPVTINAWISRGSSCSVLSTASVEVVDACPITAPVVYHPQIATSDNWFYLFVEQIPAGQTLSFEVHGTTIDFQDEQSVYVTAPSAGSFSIDAILTNGTCTRTFTYSFTVQACHAGVAVRPGQAGTCGYATAIAEFSGTPPFQGNWSDGEYFYTEETTIERPISGGTYSIPWVFDQYCQAQGTGSVTAGSTLPTPSFTVDPSVDGGYWGNDTCPGTVRTATLNGAVPAGTTVEWSIPSGTIISGQGTPVVQWSGGAVGPTQLTAVFRDPNGCDSAPYVQPYGQTLGTPQATIRVEPSTIPMGGTAVVTVEFIGYFAGGFDVSSSLGDPLVWIGNNQFEYRSTNGGGLAAITLTASNLCASGTASTTLTIDASTSAQATARVRAIGNNCETYAAWAEFTGVGPFTGTWSNGVTFMNYEPFAILSAPAAGTYTLTEFADANGPGTITGEAAFNFQSLPQPEFTVDQTTVCPNGIVTATLTTPIPVGATVQWDITDGAILSGQGTATVQFRAPAEYGFAAYVSVTAPGACSPRSEYHDVFVQNIAQPGFNLYPLYVGTSTEFDVHLDPTTIEWHFENSMNDAMEIVGNPQPNVYTLRYTSSHGTGDSTVRVYGTAACGVAVERTVVLPIVPPGPTVTLTTEPGETCGSYVIATFTGTAPFSGFWADGQTFTTSETSVRRFFSGYDFVYVYVTDAYGSPAQSEYITAQPNRPDPIPITGPTSACLGQQVTITADLPEGWTILWRVAPDPSDLSYGLRIVSGENSASVVVEGILPERGILNPELHTAEGCVNYQDLYVDVTNCP